MEMVLHKHAHQLLEQRLKQNKFVKELDTYNMLIQPLEQFFGYDQPLSSKLLLAKNHIYMQHWLTNRLQQFSNISKHKQLKMS